MAHRLLLLRIAVFALPTLIVLLCVGLTTSIAVTVQERSIRSNTAERVQEVAVALSTHPLVNEVLTQLAADTTDANDIADATRQLQPLASVIEHTAGVDFVVITETNGVRITHPTPDLRGETVSTDLDSVLAGADFLGTEVGTLGPTLRAKVAVYDGDQLLGALSVGILESSISNDHHEALSQLLPWAVGALLFGTVTSSLISAWFERRLRRQEDTAREFAALQRTATALHEQTHEFNTSLHVVHGLVSHGNTAEALEYIETLTPVMRGHSEVDLPEQALLRATVDALRSELYAMGARLETEFAVSHDVDHEVLAVLANLCRNSGEAGATMVRCTLTEVGAGSETGARPEVGSDTVPETVTRFTLHGTVEDDGPGIDPHLADRVFVRGYTSKADPGGSGRGIGLDLVRRIVSGRGGALELTKSALGGARFRFTMSSESTSRSGGST